MRLATWLKGLLLSCACLIAAFGSWHVWHGARSSRGGMRAVSATLMATIRGTGISEACYVTTRGGNPSCYASAGSFFKFADPRQFKVCGYTFYPWCQNDNTVCVRYEYYDAACQDLYDQANINTPYCSMQLP